jgi:prepilin-type N-terminal cleavage/methylation domain-containing protein
MRFASTGLRAGFRQAPSTDSIPVDAAGFTLLETLIALAILALALVGLFEAHSTALRNAAIASDYANARILGQALLADAVSGWNSSPISGTGSEGRYNWSIDVAQEPAFWADIKSNKNWRLYRIRVSVSWDKNRHLELDTLKLGHPK